MANTDLAPVLDALKLAGGGLIGATLAAFFKNFTPDGKDAREFREEYRTELKRLQEQHRADLEDIKELRDDIEALRGALDELHGVCDKQAFEFRVQVDALSVRNQKLLIERTEARALLNQRVRLDGIAVTPWPPDDVPPAPLKFTDPTGGT